MECVCVRTDSIRALYRPGDDPDHYRSIGHLHTETPRPHRRTGRTAGGMSADAGLCATDAAHLAPTVAYCAQPTVTRAQDGVESVPRGQQQCETTARDGLGR